MMLYLIKIPTFSKQGCLYKVGFTDDPSQRFYQYTDHNPLTCFLGLREGGRMEEAAFHLVLKDLGLKSIYLNEWFNGDSRVVDIFHWPISKIYKYLWRNRKRILYSKPIIREGLIWDLWVSLYRKFAGGPLDNIYFSNHYQKFPKYVVNSEIAHLRFSSDENERLLRYIKFMNLWKSNIYVIQELEKRKSPLLNELRISYSLSNP